MLDKYRVELKEDELILALVRVVQNNPQIMYDGTKVFR